MSVWDSIAGIPPGSIHLGTRALDDLLALLRAWYGIEADHWIDSEASSYRVILRICGFGSKAQARKLADEFESTQSRFGPIKEPPSGEVTPLSVQLTDGVEKPEKNGVLVIMQGGATCRAGFSIQNWFYFTEMWQYENCLMDLSVHFRSFGGGQVKNRIRMTLKPVEPYHLAITSFGNENRMFVDYTFLRDGIEIFREVARMIEEKQLMGDVKKYFTLLPQDWILYPCSSEEDALLLSGICKNLGIECYFVEKFLKLRISQNLLPGLISYFISGLPQPVFETEEEMSDENS